MRRREFTTLLRRRSGGVAACGASVGWPRSSVRITPPIFHSCARPRQSRRRWITMTAVEVYDGGGIDRAVGTFVSQADGGLIVVPNPAFDL
jgi:hypothetical protein